MKIPKNLVIPALALLLVAGAYWFGRLDAPDRSDAQVRSLLDGAKAYAKLTNELTNQVNALTAGIATRDKKLAELRKKRTPTPAIVPAGCLSWAENLSTCDQQVNVLEEQVRAGGRIKALTDQRAERDSARIDSLTGSLEKEVGKGKILGIKLPSRRTSYAAGALTGFLVCFFICPKP